MFACIVSESAAVEDLLAVARAFSPRVESAEGRRVSLARRDGAAVLLDVSGLRRIVGDPPAVGRALAREARDRGIDAAVAVAATRTAATIGAWCAGRVQDAGRVIVIPSGEERQALGEVSIAVLSALGLAEHLPTLGRWGLRTLGEVAALAPADLHARLGAAGLALHRVACGRDDRPLVPHVDAARFEASLDLEWPIETLEPLSFVLARLLEPLSAALERADRGAAAIALTLTLVTREAHGIRLELPAPMRDARTLRTLLALALEARPAPAGIDRVAIVIDPTPGRIVQHSLLQRALPSPECLTTLVARLEALMGAGRVGVPALVDSHEPGAFELRNVDCGLWIEGTATVGGNPHSTLHTPQFVLRRFRLPVPARVDLDRGRPARVTTMRRGLAGGRVVQCAGPWRASGGWWAPRIATEEVCPRRDTEAVCPRRDTEAVCPRRDTDTHGSTKKVVPCPSVSLRGPKNSVSLRGPKDSVSLRGWNRDEWDVAAPDGVYRIYRDRDTDRWFLEGILD